MKTPKLLILLQFLVKGALSIDIVRALRGQGWEIAIAICEDASATYLPDAMDDFRATGDLIDLSALEDRERLKLIDQRIARDRIELIVQIGATDLYHHLPYWKERHPKLRIADVLYNEFGHTLNHFLYEGCIDAAVVESEFMREFVRRSSGKATTWIEVVHSGVDLDEFTPTDDLGAPSHELRLGYVGRMSPEKNPLGFIELAEKLAPLNPCFEFEMFGAGSDASAVKERLLQSSAGARIRYHGFIEHSRDALRQLDVLIVPSKFDGRPVIIMEANACGIPVIAAPVGGIPELVTDGRNGFLVLPTGIDRIHAVLDEWLQDPQSLARHKRAARNHASQYFDRRQMMDAYAAAFLKIAA
ncbi:MAG: glycosyltransferase family 4 protein [Variovorax sp.]